MKKGSCTKNEKIIIHLGFHKTGTSFLQYELFSKMEGVNLLVHPYDVRDIHIKPNMINVLSGEGYSKSLPHWGEVDRGEILHYLETLFPNAKIVVGFRERSSWLRSCYAQYVVGYQGTLPYDDYIKTYACFTISPTEYLAMIQARWNDVFVYHQETLKDEINSLCEFIGVPVPSFEYRLIHVSLSPRQLYWYRMMNILLGSKFSYFRKYLYKVRSMKRG